MMTKENKKNRILKVAEELFSKNGFDGTSVDSIAKGADVNKALIYYYFDSKNDIIISLFRNIQDELVEHLKHEFESDNQNIQEKIKKEIKYLKGRKKIIALLLMESFKENKDNFLFQFSEISIKGEIKDKEGIKNRYEREKFFVHEFFTGFIPILTYIAYEDKWCEYFKCDHEKMIDYFVDSLINSHFKSHLL